MIGMTFSFQKMIFLCQMQLNREKFKNANWVEWIKVQIILLNLYWNKFVIWLFSNLLFHSKLPQNPQKILIYRWGSIGDCVCAFPAIYNIKEHYPEAIIDIENNSPGTASFMEKLLDPTFYRKIINSGNMPRSSFFELLKEERYDVYLMLLGSKYSLLPILKRMIFIRLAGIKYAKGFEVFFISYFRKTQVKFFDFDSVTNNLKKMLFNNGIPISKHNEYPLYIKNEDNILIDKLIGEIGVNRQNITLCIGGSAENRKWSIENYQAIADLLSSKFNVFLIGGKEDIEKGNQLKNVYNFCGKLSIMQSALLMQKCLLTVSNDTGPMHLSYAVGTPVIGLFSNWEFPNTWHPPEDKFNVALRAKNIPCEVCLLQECPYNNRCINEISVESVEREIRKLLTKLQQ
jgi:ADP-heptose:LPS heptosyltransferase